MLEKYVGYDKLYQKSNVLIDKMFKTHPEICKFQSGKICNELLKLNKKDYFILPSAFNLFNLCEKLYLIEKYAEKIKEKINLTGDSKLKNPRLGKNMEESTIIESNELIFMFNFNRVIQYFISFKSYSTSFFKSLEFKIENMHCFAQIKNFNSTKLNPYITDMENSFFNLDYKKLEDLCNYFPKLHREEIISVLEAASGAWFKCQNGHIYTVGECGRPMEESICPECKSKIGGINHNPHIGNNSVKFT